MGAALPRSLRRLSRPPVPGQTSWAACPKAEPQPAPTGTSRVRPTRSIARRASFSSLHLLAYPSPGRPKEGTSQNPSGRTSPPPPLPRVRRWPPSPQQHTKELARRRARGQRHRRAEMTMGTVSGSATVGEIEVTVDTKRSAGHVIIISPFLRYDELVPVMAACLRRYTRNERADQTWATRDREAKSRAGNEPTPNQQNPLNSPYLTPPSRHTLV